MNQTSTHLRNFSLLLIVVTFAQAAPRQSQYSGHALDLLMEKYQGASLELNTDKIQYVLGQFIYIRYRIMCDAPRQRPWGNAEILGWTVMLRDGARTGWERLGMPSHGQIIANVGTEFEGLVQANGSFWDKHLSDSVGFHVMAPGSYIGYFDRGILSPDFTFDIVPPPDSLIERWNDYCILRRISEGAFRGREYSAMDSVSEIMQRFMTLPDGSLWRKEALDQGALAFGIAQFWVPLRPTDIQLLESVIESLADEAEMPAMGVVSAAVRSLCRRNSSAETANALIEFAERLGNPEVLDYARKWSDRVAQTHGENER